MRQKYLKSLRVKMMFRPENWAEAFINIAGSVPIAEEALEYLKIFCNAALSLRGNLSGRNEADRLGRSIRISLTKFSDQNSGNSANQLAERFVQLMLRKGCFLYYLKIIERIEKRIYKLKNAEKVFVETPVELDNDFIAVLKEKAKCLTQTADVMLIITIVPELIGGIKLRWGNKQFDGSVRHALQKMASDLNHIKTAGFKLEM